MRHSLVLGLAVIWLTIATACSPAIEPSQTAEYLPPTPIETVSVTLPEALVQRLKSYFASELAIAPNTITVQSADAVEWSDACLGVSNPDELCAQVITPGYRVVLDTSRGRYEVHTDKAGQRIRLARSPE